MKKIIMALAMLSISYCSAEAHMKCKTVKAAHKSTTAHVTKAVTTSPNHEKYAQNFAVCKADCGYTICGEIPSSRNTTPTSCAKQLIEEETYNYTMPSVMNEPSQDMNKMNKKTPEPLMAPQSQSYPAANNPYATTPPDNGSGKIEVYYDSYAGVKK